MARNFERETGLVRRKDLFGGDFPIDANSGMDGSDEHLFGTDNQQNVVVGDTRQHAANATIGSVTDDRFRLTNGPTLGNLATAIAQSQLSISGVNQRGLKAR